MPATNAPKKIPLPHAPRALQAHGCSVSYIRLWRAVVEGQVPAERAGGRWMLHPADLPTIAKTLAARG